MPRNVYVDPRQVVLSCTSDSDLVSNHGLAVPQAPQGEASRGCILRFAQSDWPTMVTAHTPSGAQADSTLMLDSSLNQGVQALASSDDVTAAQPVFAAIGVCHDPTRLTDEQRAGSDIMGPEV